MTDAEVAIAVVEAGAPCSRSCARRALRRLRRNRPGRSTVGSRCRRPAGRQRCRDACATSGNREELSAWQPLAADGVGAAGLKAAR